MIAQIGQDRVSLIYLCQPWRINATGRAFLAPSVIDDNDIAPEAKHGFKKIGDLKAAQAGD
jgi:hypothetical protein